MNFTRQLVDDYSDLTKLSAEQSEFALRYISYYYQDAQKGRMSLDDVNEHVRTIQSQLGLEETGQIDAQLVKTLEYTPRCGLTDQDIKKSAAGDKWGIKNLTYFVEQYVKNLSRADQDDILQTAFNYWTEVADIRFTRSNSKSSSNLVISTGQGRGDGFDGPSNTLAWAYLPPTVNYNGQLLMRFDLDETWTKISSDRGIMMLNVACHEFGHMLGLEHSRYQKALMAPYYSPSIPKPQAQDDIPRIQALYGKPTTVPTNPPTNPTPGTKYKVEIEVDSISAIKINGKSPIDFNLI